MENLKIYVDRLKGGNTCKINETLPSDFLEVDEEELLFDDPIEIRGEAYIVDEHLVIQLCIETAAYLPCSVCNDAVQTSIRVKNLYLTKPLNEIKGAIFDLAEEIRESILLQVPLFIECNNGKCPERENIKKFLKSDPSGKGDTDVVQFPFADLDK